MIIKGKLYDYLKWIAQILLPAAGALYFGLAGQLGLPNADTVVGSLAVIGTFLGAILGFSTVQYNKSDEKYDGDFTIERAPDGDTATLSVGLSKGGAELVEKDELKFKLKKPE